MEGTKDDPQVSEQVDDSATNREKTGRASLIRHDEFHSRQANVNEERRKDAQLRASQEAKRKI